MNKNITHKIPRAALILLLMLTMSLTASATNFITDVMVAGHSNQSSFNTLIQDLQGQGWTDINQDLNQGCGSSSYYIHLLYKTQSSTGNTGVPITDFYIRTGANPPASLTHQGRTYYLVPCQGNDNFTSGHGDLNAGCGSSSDYIFLYYTKDAMSNNTGVTAITFNTTQSGAVGSNGGSTGYDLNSGAHGSYIYMHLTTASGANVVTLSSGSGNVALQNGHILTGTGGTETQVTIADGATVTFNGVNNTAIPDNSSHQWPGISCLGNATIVLNGSTTNSVKGGRGGSGIHVAANKTLTIQGSGTLNATGGYRGAGIGSGWGSSCGNITISGGTITANGDDGAAGIGSGWQSSCGNITISGGTVTATGGQSAAGVGSGYYNSSCGNITITNGVTRVTATKGQSSNNSVGAGNSSTCGTVTIGGVQTGNITMSPFVTYPYTVAFDANGGTGTMANQVFMYNVAQNLTANSFTRTSYTFEGWATSATGPKVYNNGQSVSNLTQTAGATVTLYAKWTADPTHLSVNGNVYTIHTATGWNLFCDMLAENSNGYFTGKTVKQDANITVDRMAGSSGHEFSGIFDGQSHTLTVSYQNTLSTPTAPFSYVNGATIQNLVVAGNFTGTASRAAGIVGETGSSLSHVTNCLSSVNVSGGGYTGGISVGGNVEITGCVFNGKITGIYNSGGFVGCSNSALVICNCLFAPQGGSSLSGGTFYYNGGGEITPVNSYYITSLGTPQGKQAHSIAAGENVTVAINNQVTTTYSVSGISASSVGMVYNNTYYAGEGDAVSLNLGCAIPNDYTLFGYQASAGTLTGTTNPYTLTMPDADVTIQAILELVPDSIGYIDGDSITHTCDNFTVLLGNETTLDEGWYVVYSDLTYDHTLTLNGNVTLILCNHKMMTVAPSSGRGIHGFQKSLTLYGQSLDSNVAGTLNVIGDGSYTAIELSVGTYTQHSGNVVANGDRGIFADNLTINGGSIHANGGDRGIDAGDLTINGGSINANGGYYGIIAGDLTINGGTVIANSNQNFGDYSGLSINGNLVINGGKVEAFSIWAAGNITLGWTNIDDYILAGSYLADGTISVKSGQAFYYNNNVIVSDTLNSSQIQAIGGKTLRPYIVNYMDGNGEVYICTDYTVLTGNETDLEAGWYLVNNDISYHRTLFLNGDVTLILCNGKTMAVSPETGEGIYGWLSSLTIYGQSLNLNDAGILNVIGDGTNRTIELSLGTYTQHSGNVVVNNLNNHALYADHITMNGGNIAASGNYGIKANIDMNFNGGKVEASSIYAGDSITIGWTNADDYIHAGSYETDGGIFSVKSGQAFYYDNVIVSGTLNNSQINAISGKTLRPYIEPCLPPFNLEVTDIRDNEATLHWTSGAEIYNVSYYKTFFFDSFEEDLSQWTIYKEGDDASWEWGIENPHDNSADLNAHSGHYAAVAYSDFDIHADSWLVTPQIQFPNQTTLKFWIMRSPYDDARDEYEVRLSTTGNAISDFTTILKEKAAANSYWTEVSIDLSEYDGQQGYIAIRHDYTDGFFIMVDDFGIFGWSEDIATTDNSLLIEDLLPETEYLWHVQANCGDEVGLSQWSSIDNFTTLSTCPVPIGLSASNETNHGATLDWTGLSDSYQVMVGSSEGASSTTYTVMEVPFILDDAQHIQPGTSYTVKVKGFCDDKETDFCEPIVFTTTSSCWPVNSLSYENLTSFSVNLNWVLEDETQTTWQICLNNNENNLVAANTNEGFLLGNLTPNTEYTVKVRANCDANDYSRWSNTITFTTPEVCATPTELAVTNTTALSADLSWIGRDDVESYTVRYRSTTGIVAHYIEDFSDNIDSWTLVDCESRTGITNGAFAFYRVADANNPNPHQYLISPDLTSYITSNSVLEFKYRAYASSYAETFMVGFSSTNNEVGSFSWSNPITVATNEYQTYHATLPTGTKYIAIQCISYRKYYLLIDDIIVGNEAIGGEWMTKTTAETETQLINLDAGTQYEVQVRSDCNPDGWCNMITFETELDGTMVFVTEGDWNTASNWVPQGTPALNNKVIIRADVTIPSGCVAEANRILFEGTTLTIENGGQLKVNSDIEATIKKNFAGYGANNAQTNNGFNLIAMPAVTAVNAANAGLVATDSKYDLYSWNRTATDEEWHNNHSGISMENGTGYLYANQGDVEMNITATVQRSSLSITKTPAYDEEHGGWNLYGNPFPCEAYLSSDDDVTFYRLIGTDFVPVTGAIAPMEGFFVKATAANQTFTISRAAMDKSGPTSCP